MFQVLKDLRVDSRGNCSTRMCENMAMDPDTGTMPFTTPWESDDSGGKD